MRKNILAIIILATVLINLTLTGVTLFVVIPNANRTNELVTKILSIIDLELESPDEADNISIEDITAFNVNEDGDMPVNLKKTDGSSVTHYVAVSCSLSLNKKAEDFSKKQALLTEQLSFIKETVQTEIGNYTFENVMDNKENIKLAILDKLKEHFETESIIGVSFSNFVVQ